MYSRDELKTFISEKLIGKQKSIPYSRQTHRWYEIRNLVSYYDSIFENTNYLPTNSKFNERCFQIVNDLFEIQKCPTCNSPINYVDFTNGYRKYCSPKCATKGKKQIDVFIEKYGLEIGTEKYNTMIKNKTQTEERFIELYGEKEGEKRWKSRNKKCQNNGSIQGFIERYGTDEGKLKYTEYCCKLKKSHTLSEYIKRYGQEEGTKKYNETIRKKSQSLDRFIEIYGEEDGLKRFKEYKSKNSKKSNASVSKESLEFFKPILEYILTLDDDIIMNTYIGSKNKQEYFLIDTKLNRTYFYDLTIEPLKLIFEYNGSAFHPNKNLLNENEWKNWKTVYSNIPADEKFEYDQRKLEIARNNGFTIIEIWDSDDTEKAQEKCKIMINSKLAEYTDGF